VKAIRIDDYLEAAEERRAPSSRRLGTPAAGDWGRLVAEGRDARAEADGGRWKIGHLAGLVERRYATGAVQRFAEEIGESYSTVRRYRWVSSRYEQGVRFKFPSLSFSHYQAVAGLPDRLAWLHRAEHAGWSVDELTRRSRPQEPTTAPGSEDQIRASIEGVRRYLTQLANIDDRALPRESRRWLAQTLADLAGEIARLQERLRVATASRRSPAAARHRRR
jgi:hypothetical protein